ncbi:hypothetical protein [Paenibacillus larvae]|uniref:hypothetical protein n=1 Tax=Paenibacillus larvae TaxID=1464 RepID=UPI002853F33C|nr:hypothetical protein [Paenibacillus larvae]MDR5600797.1 hypothetical protein [Paenibacillus larvae]
MKKVTEFHLEDAVYKIRITYSTLLKMRDDGIDMMTEQGAAEIQKDPGKLAKIFWYGLNEVKGQEYTFEQAMEILDDILSEIYMEDFVEILQDSIQIKTRQAEEHPAKKKKKK